MIGKALVACEESQAVCIALRAKGWEAYSCDILPCSGGHPDWHIQDDVRNVLAQHWDMLIAFPDCTFLTVSNTYLKRGCSKYTAEQAKVYVQQAKDFFMMFVNHPCKLKSIENPIGVMSTEYRKPDQIIQPWQFGDDASKATCLWLKNLPVLQHTNIIAPKEYSLIRSAVDMIECPDCEEPYCELCDCHYADCECLGPTQDDVNYKTISGFMFGTLQDPAPRPVWGNQTPSGQNKLGPSEDRAKLRSKTYPGIAQAMADQWTDFYLKTVCGL